VWRILWGGGGGGGGGEDEVKCNRFEDAMYRVGMLYNTPAPFPLNETMPVI